MRPKPITAQELPNVPEIFLGIAALLIIIAGAWERTAVLVVIGLIMGTGTMISLGLTKSLLLRGMFSFLTVSATFGALLFIWWIQEITRGGSGDWITWVVFISSLLTLFAAYRAAVLGRY